MCNSGCMWKKQQEKELKFATIKHQEKEKPVHETLGQQK